jgi:hypothetical protein
VEAGWTHERRRGPELDATFRRPTSRYKVVQLVPEWIGNMGAASQGGWHAEFVTDTTSDAAGGAAVCRPDAIIPFKPVRPTGFVLCLAGLYIQSLNWHHCLGVFAAREWGFCAGPVNRRVTPVCIRIGFSGVAGAALMAPRRPFS